MLIQSSVQSLVKALSTLDLDLETAHDDILSDVEIYKIFDAYASEKTKQMMQESYDKIFKKIEELEKYEKDHNSDSDRDKRAVERFKSYISSSINKFLQSTKDYVQEYLSPNLAEITPQWIMPMSFSGAETIIGNPNYEFIKPSKTTGAAIIKTKQWQHRKLTTDAGFVVGVVNCSVSNIGDRTVSEKTLQGASSGDRESFDSIHELERIYQETPLGLGIIQINQDDLQIISDHDLSSLILKHARQQEKAPSSLSLYIISESYNLAKDGKTSVADILARVPFAQLKEMGMCEVVVDFISCNTAEIAAEMIKNANKIAADQAMTIKITFHNGYIFNNISYCYMDSNEHKALIDQGTVPKTLYCDHRSIKKSRVIQVMEPGFSSILAKDTDELGGYVMSKSVPAGLDSETEVSKKLIKPDAIKSIRPGESWQYTATGKQLELTPLSRVSKIRGSGESLVTPKQRLDGIAYC